MVEVKNIDHLNLTVEDFDRTVEWYGRVFGFELVEDKVKEGVRWGVIRRAKAMLCIYQHPEFELEVQETRMGRKIHGIAHFGLRINDPGTWEETVAREGIRVLYDGPIRWAHSTSWYINDPTGYEIEVACWDGDEINFD